MAEIDPIILQLRADVQKYRAELLTTTNMVDASLGRQEKAVLDLERQIKSSSGQIASSLKSMAGAFASYLSVRQIAAVIDSYTRFQNSLRVAGLEGQKLAEVQERLRQIGSTYGVELESLGDLFSRASMAQKELGASTSQIIQLNEIIAAGLKITGASASQASGALLQLGQALGAGVVRAEEFNSIIEGAYPVAQAAARGIDGMGGSVAKLRTAIADGKVSSKEFFEGVLRGGVETIKQAEGATLTLSGAMTKLSNEFTIYIGEGSKANGVTKLVSGAIGLLADNLDSVADAVAVISALLAGRLVASLVATATAARLAGASMLTAFGGPVGLAVAAFTLALGFLASRAIEAAGQIDGLKAEADDLERTADQMRARLERAGIAIDGVGTAASAAKSGVDDLAAAMERAKRRAKELEDQAGITAIRLLQLRVTEAQNARVVAERQQSESQERNTRARARFTFSDDPNEVRIQNDQQKVIDEARRVEAAAREQIRLISINPKVALGDTPGAGTTVATKDKPKKSPKGRSGPTAEEIAARHAQELDRILADQLNDELAITQDVERRREIFAELDRIEYDQRLAQIENDKNFTAAQKRAQVEALNRYFGRGNVGPDGEIPVTATFRARARKNDELERDARNRAQRSRDEGAALQAEAELVDVRITRLAIERAILEQREIEERAALDAAIASGQIAASMQEQAKQTLEREQKARRERTNRDFESPFQSYARRLRNQGDNISDEMETLVVQRIDELDDAISDTISSKLGVKDPLLKQLLNLFIQQNLLRPIAEAFSGTGGGGGGLLSGIGSFFGSLFGRASGGYVGPGQTVRVNEHKGGVELLRMGPQGGQVIPLGQANARAARPDNRPVVVSAPQFNMRGAILTRELFAEMERISDASASRAASASYQQAMKDAPNAVTQARRFGSSSY